ncbi:MAG: glycerophosphodiester phosphodiesterase [Bacteroidales bacterium]|nr:glycerophosphodiester phosphodiesterase [Bacteroidales bacterium]
MKKIFLVAATVIATLSTLCASAQNAGTAICAHRGFWKCAAAGYSENSIASLREAQNIDCWGSEFDIHITADDVVIVNHNRDIAGTTIWDHNFADFKDFRLPNGEGVSTLDEYLTQGEKGPQTMLVCELKIQKDEEREDLMLAKTIECLKAHGLYSPDKVMFISFSLHLCKEIARIAPEFTNQYLNGKISPAELKAMGINGLDYQIKQFQAHPEWVKEAHDLGMSVNVWTVNDEETIKEMIDLGVDCITTNEPYLVRQLLGNKEIKRVAAKDSCCCKCCK